MRISASSALLTLAFLAAGQAPRPAGLIPLETQPDSALAPGPQSKLGLEEASRALREAGVTGRDGLKDAARIGLWLNENFHSYAAGGKLIAKTTASGLLSSRELSGCHDWGLIVGALLRAAGYPAVLVDTAGVEWMRESRAGRGHDEHDGHVFVEAYIEGRWVLLNLPDTLYLDGYDPSNPAIPLEVGNQTRYVAMMKGLDPESYGLPRIDLGSYMDGFAAAVDPETLPRQNGRAARLPSAGAALPPISDETLARPTQADSARKGLVLQFHKSGVDVYVEKSGGVYLAHLYKYGRVFSEPLETRSFESLAALRGYLRGLEP